MSKKKVNTIIGVIIALQANENVTEVKVTQDTMLNVTEGTVIIFDYADTGLKMARKVIGINEDNGLILSDELKIEEIVEYIEVSDISEVSFSDIHNYYHLRYDCSKN